MIERRVQMLTRFLSLTEAQATQATTIFTQAQASAEPVRTSLREAHQAMRTAVKANDSGGIATAASSIGTLTGQEAAIQGRADAAFYAILTAEQKAKHDQMGPGRMGPGGMGPGGMGMGPGGMGMRGPRPPQQ